MGSSGFDPRGGTPIANTLFRNWLYPASFVRPGPCLARGGFFVAGILATGLSNASINLVDRGAVSLLVT